jgi:hypothetical protein
MSGTEEGTLFVVVRFPAPWPVPRDFIVFHKPTEHGAAEIKANPDARLILTVYAANGSTVLHTFRSCPLTIVGDGLVILSAQWGLGICSLRINQSAIEQEGNTVTEIFATQRLPKQDLSINHADAATVCANWVQRRQAKFAVRPRLRRARYKTIQEESADLHRALLCLEDLRIQLIGGKAHLLGLLAAELRALTYWQKDDSPDHGYNPLLLRMASKADLPLPVYGMKDFTRPPGPQASIHLSGDVAKLRRAFATEELVDLQHWMKRILFEIDLPPVTAMTAKELISETANSLGASHYDEDVSAFVSALREMTAGDRNALLRLLCDLAETVGALGEWVLSELKRRGLI